MLKIIHSLIDIPANTHLILLSSDHNTRGHQKKFKQPMTRINFYLHSFFSVCNKIWNSLNDDIVSSITLSFYCACSYTIAYYVTRKVLKQV